MSAAQASGWASSSRPRTHGKGGGPPRRPEPVGPRHAVPPAAARHGLAGDLLRRAAGHPALDVHADRPEGAEIGVYTQTFTFANYTETLSEYAATFGRSFLYAFIATVLALAISYPLAYVIAFKAGRWRNLLLVLVIAPFFTSFLMRTLAWKTILADDGRVVVRTAVPARCWVRRTTSSTRHPPWSSGSPTTSCRS